MRYEAKYIKNFDARLIDSKKAEDILGYATQIIEVGHSCTVPRAYLSTYNLSDAAQLFESVAGHTQLLEKMVDCALEFEHGPYLKRTSDGFRYREIIEAVRRHDLPENTFGDKADNGNRDDKGLAKKEHSYWWFFSELSPKCAKSFEKKVYQLLLSMQRYDTPTGRKLYVADKAAAIIIALCCEQIGIKPGMHFEDNKASANEFFDMSVCDSCEDKFYLASEMWTVDFFKTRQICQYDDNGFFIALIVMITLIIHEKWYRWRAKDYNRFS